MGAGKLWEAQLWLIPPSMSSGYVQASEVSSSESSWLFEELERSAWWRGKPRLAPAWSRAWRRVGWTKLLSGWVISEPSTRAHIVASFISSLRETPARTTALPVDGLGPVETGSSLPRSSASPMSAGLILSSARTCRGTRTDSLKPSSRHWSVPNGGRTASHAEKVGNTLYHGDKKVQLGLEHQAAQWPGPARDFKGVNREAPTPDYNARPLNEIAANWNTPLVADAGEKVTLASHQASLLAQASSFRPPSSPAQPIAAGSISSTEGPNSNQPSVKRKLNPIFVEALMRWPTGLSGFERQEMAWTRWWRLMPSFVLMLCSPPVEEQGRLL